MKMVEKADITRVNSSQHFTSFQLDYFQSAQLTHPLPRLTGVVASCRSNFVFLSTLEGAVVAEHGILVSTSLGEDAIGESQLRDCVVESKLCSFLSMLVKRMFQQ